MMQLQLYLHPVPVFSLIRGYDATAALRWGMLERGLLGNASLCAQHTTYVRIYIEIYMYIG